MEKPDELQKVLDYIHDNDLEMEVFKYLADWFAVSLQNCMKEISDLKKGK